MELVCGYLDQQDPGFQLSPARIILRFSTKSLAISMEPMQMISIRKALPCDAPVILYYFEKPVGYYKIKLAIDYEHQANAKYGQLQKIYILKSHLHLKLGRLVMEHIFSLEEVAGCETIWLVVLNTNYSAIKFYERQGFKNLKKYFHTIGTHRLEYNLMVKPISCA